MNELETYKVQGVDVSFLVRKDVWVNATEMANGSGKRPVDWLRLPSTKEFLAALGNVRKSHILVQDDTNETSGKSRILVQDEDALENGENINDSVKSEILVRTVRGVHGGTWMHEDVAIEFARWLSPEFSVWCNMIIKKLFQEGHIDIRPMLEVRKQVEELGHKRVAGITVNDSFSRLLPYMYEFMKGVEILSPFTDEAIYGKELRGRFKAFLDAKGVNSEDSHLIEKFVREDYGVPCLKKTQSKVKYFFR